jgi:hypothetical protein
MGVILAVMMPCSVMAAPPAVTPSTASVSVNPTSLAVVYPSARQLVQSFTASTRASTVPVASGQLAIETDTRLLFGATGTSAGNWTEIVPDASETAEGKLELATQAETDTGSDDLRAVTPLKLQTKLNGIIADADSGFRISSNGAGGYKLELWNSDQSAYQEIRIAGASGAERIVIVTP